MLGKAGEVVVVKMEYSEAVAIHQAHQRQRVRGGRRDGSVRKKVLKFVVKTMT